MEKPWFFELEYKPDRELDALVEEKVFDQRVDRDWPCGREPECGSYDAAMKKDADLRLAPWLNERGPVRFIETCPEPVPFYSTCPEACWTLLVPRYRTVAVERTFGGDWTATIGADDGRGMDSATRVSVRASTVERAFVLAALERLAKVEDRRLLP